MASSAACLSVLKLLSARSSVPSGRVRVHSQPVSVMTKFQLLLLSGVCSPVTLLPLSLSGGTRGRRHTPLRRVRDDRHELRRRARELAHVGNRTRKQGY